jgi:hypothetical protein
MIHRRRLAELRHFVDMRRERNRLARFEKVVHDIAVKGNRGVPGAHEKVHKISPASQHGLSTLSRDNAMTFVLAVYRIIESYQAGSGEYVTARLIYEAFGSVVDVLEAEAVNRVEAEAVNPVGAGGKALFRQLPAILAMGVLLLDIKTRNEVASDLEDWYQEISETRGTRWAKFFAFMKLASALGNRILSIAERVAAVIGTARGRKKTE